MVEKQGERFRAERVASRVREELSTLLRETMKDPRLANVVLTDLAVTQDLSLVRVGLVVMGDDKAYTKATAAAKVLVKNQGAITRALAPKLSMRRVPSFEFAVDRGRVEVERLDSLMHEVSGELKQSEARAKERGPEEPAPVPEGGLRTVRKKPA